MLYSSNARGSHIITAFSWDWWTKMQHSAQRDVLFELLLSLEQIPPTHCVMCVGCACFCLFLCARLSFVNCREGVKTQAGQWSALLCLSLLYNWHRGFGSPMWNLHFPAQLSSTRTLEEPAAIPKPDVISTFIDCFTSAKTTEWKLFLQ